MRISHWLPIVTICPVNGLPDVVYIYAYFEGFAELYEVRRTIRRLASMRCAFMEEIAADVLKEMPDTCFCVEVVLLTGRHIANARRVR
jgi:hypothetical protein